VSALPAREAYRLWAPEYDQETAVSALEAATVDALRVVTSGRALLDVGCGTARRLRASGASTSVGVDFSLEMLRRAPREGALVAGDLRALPIAGSAFDVVWCRLAVGHLRELDRAYAELARVCRVRGMVVVTDLSPDAALAGHRRTFRDETGTVHDVEHFLHTMDAHAHAAERAGLALVERRDGVCGENIKRFYAEAGRMRAYEEQHGTPIVLALAWRKIVG
jgi:malonyl-CoA O-methyltransferase